MNWRPLFPPPHQAGVHVVAAPGEGQLNPVNDAVQLAVHVLGIDGALEYGL